MADSMADSFCHKCLATNLINWVINWLISLHGTHFLCDIGDNYVTIIHMCNILVACHSTYTCLYMTIWVALISYIIIQFYIKYTTLWYTWEDGIHHDVHDVLHLWMISVTYNHGVRNIDIYVCSATYYIDGYTIVFCFITIHYNSLQYHDDVVNLHTYWSQGGVRDIHYTYIWQCGLLIYHTYICMWIACIGLGAFSSSYIIF